MLITTYALPTQYFPSGDGKDSAMLGGLQCQVRRVDEVTRGVTNRDEYEKVARDIRYAFYKQCMAQASATTDSGEDNSDFNNGNNSKNEVVLSGVIFGHHEGDVQENVISNVMRYQKLTLFCTCYLIMFILIHPYTYIQRVRSFAIVRYERCVHHQWGTSVAPSAGPQQR